MRKLVLSCVCLLALAAASVAQGPDYSKVEIKVQKLAGTVYMLQGAGGNLGASVGDDGVVLIDTQYRQLGEKIEAALKSLSGKPLRFVVNTHWHSDHVSGNQYFGAKAPIIAHENVRKILMTGGKNRFGASPAAPAIAWPAITYTSEMTLHLNGEDIVIRHWPGHTNGDSIVLFPKSNVVHLGDDFFNGTFPFIDTDNGGNALDLIANLEKLMAELPEDVKIIPGHGPLATKADLRKYLTMLKETSAAVADGMKQGKTLEQLKQEKVLAKWDAFGQGFMKADVFTDILYDSIKQK